MFVTVIRLNRLAALVDVTMLIRHLSVEQHTSHLALMSIMKSNMDELNMQLYKEIGVGEGKKDRQTDRQTDETYLEQDEVKKARTQKHKHKTRRNILTNKQ